MKDLFVGLILVVTANNGWAQIEMKLKPRIPIQEADTIFVRSQPSFSSSSRLLNLDSSRFSHSAAAGSVYISQQDGMRWLKPDTTVVYNMPIQNTSVIIDMPNGYRPSAKGLFPFLRRKP